MSTERVFPSRDDLAAVVTAGLGPGRRLDSVQRLRGGSKKGVYRLGLSGGASVIGVPAKYWSEAWGPRDVSTRSGERRGENFGGFS